jgi:superoxide dismutase, Cu-Zn family
MIQLSRVYVLSCAMTIVGCSSADPGDTDTSTTAPQTSSATEPATGSTGPTTNGPTTGSSTDPGTTVDTPTTTPDPTTSGTTEQSMTGDPDATSLPGTDTGMSETTEGSETTGAPVTTASSSLDPKSGSQVTGSAVFTDIGGGQAELVIKLSNVTPPGTHALHIHELPDCSADDGTSTGDHWNPNGTMLGELGTVEIADDGTGVFMKSDAWTIGSGQFDDVVDHSIIIHAEANGGTRIACGVIAKD